VTNNIFSNARDIVAVGGGIVGLIGGIIGIVSALRPPKIVVAHTDHLGVVASTAGLTPSVQLPLVFSNHAKKPGVVTSLKIKVRPIDDKKATEYLWGIFWKDDPSGNRIPERKASPIPIQGFTCVERNVQFDRIEFMEWEPRIYEIELHIKVGRKIASKKVSRFYVKPSSQKCALWKDNRFTTRVDFIPTYLTVDDIPNVET